MKFGYNNAKNTSTKYISFEHNYKYYLYVSYKKNANFYSKSKVDDKLIKKLKNLIATYKKNLCYI